MGARHSRLPCAARQAALPLPLLLALLLALCAPAGAAPDWSLEDTGGQRVSFAEALARGPVVVSFWASWCKPCLKEMPHLEELATAFDGRVTFLTVNTDDSKSVAKVEPLVRSRGWKHLTVLLDTGATVQQQLQVDSLPYVLLYDRDGREAYRHAGYVEGGEVELEAAIVKALAAADDRPPAASGLATDRFEPGSAATAPGVATGLTAGELKLTDRFEYSYAGETRREIVENWLDASWRQGSVRAGLTLNSQAPGEEHGRRNEITHRWFELTRGESQLRVGHFHGLFGRGLLFNAWQDRDLRIDTRLDGVLATIRHGDLSATVLSGTPSVRELDVRGMDLEWAAGRQLACGVSGLTWHNSSDGGTEPVDREWALALRARQSLARAAWYVEVAGRNRMSLDAFDDTAAEDVPREGWALYGNVNLYPGPFTVSWEGSDYEDFDLVSRADDVTALNRPPALAREFTWTLLNRAPHALNANDEKGHNLDLSWQGPDGLTVQASAARLRRHDGGTSYESAYLAIEKERWRGLGLIGGFGYQNSEGLRQTAAVEISAPGPAATTWSLQAEHQHVRPGGGRGFDLGAYDQQWFKLECAVPSGWILTTVLETNNKYPDHRSRDEEPGPFLAAQVSRSLAGGATVTLWGGERQEGFICSGGVCKFEPAFSGVEFFGTLRW